MMTETSLTCPPSNAVGLERTRFFHRMLVGPDDLTQDQLYFRERARRHNRMLHGWGIVCGARVRDGTEPCQVVVEPGYLLGPYGDEIIIDREVTVDLCAQDLDGNAVGPCAPADPWCADVQVDRPSGQPLYLAVRHEECTSRAVRVSSNGCGCDAADCEYSRIRDSFAIRVLDTLPNTYSDPMTPPGTETLLRCPPEEDCAGIACWACPTEPWVILADVTLDGDTVSEIDCASHRRYVASFGSFFFMCQPRQGVVVGPERIVLVDEVRPAIMELLDEEGIVRLEAEHAGEIAAVATLPASQLRGVTSGSTVGRAIGAKTIGEIASTPKEAFLASVLTGVPESRRTAVTNQATLLWSRARVLTNLSGPSVETTRVGPIGPG
jgi:hypothetical protein